MQSWVFSQWLSEAGQEETETEVMSLVWKPKRKGDWPGVGATRGPKREAVQGPPGPGGCEALSVPWGSSEACHGEPVAALPPTRLSSSMTGTPHPILW